MESLIYPIDVFEKYLDHLVQVPEQLKPFISKNPINYKGKGGWRRDHRLKKSLLLTKNKSTSGDNSIKEAVTDILNKISEKNFENQCEKLMNLEVKNKKHLDDFVEVVFIKAIREQAFAKIYAKLCRRLVGCYVEEPEKDETKKIYFRDLLITRCQNMFERSTSMKDEFADQEELFKFKDNILGCMNFIGELYNHELLTDKIIFTCFYMLNRKLQYKYMYTADCMCALFEAAGNRFFSKSPDLAHKCYQYMDNLIKIPDLPNKDKFAVMDVLDKYEEMVEQK